MNSCNVLITGIGSEPGLSAVKALRRYFGKEITLVGVDCNPLAPGLYLDLFDKTFVVPHASSPAYLEMMLSLAKSEAIDLILPANDDEVYQLSLNQSLFGRGKVIASDPKTIETCRDKWLTFEALHDILEMPQTTLDPAKAPLPCIIKPRTGHGARGIETASTEEELHVLKKRVKNPLFQELVEGDEWTIDCLCSHTGALLAAVPRKRRIYAAGTSYIGEIVREPVLIKMAEVLTRSLTFCGPFNFQTRNFKLFEINPRIAAASIFSAASGINMAALAILDYRGEPVERQGEFKEMIATRYLQEIFVEKTEIKKPA